MLIHPFPGLVFSAIAGIQAPPPCPAPGQPDAGWREAIFVGLDLKLRLPTELRSVPYSNLAGPARRNEDLGIPRLARDSARLVAAWERPGRGTSEIRGVYLYQVSPRNRPRGRGCTLLIAGHGGLVLRHVISGDSRDQDQHWTEGSWPGFVLAAQGVSPSAFEGALRILGTLSAIR